MIKPTYLYYVIEKYISLSMACIFVLENYLQETCEVGYMELREKYEKWMKYYDILYEGREHWNQTQELLIDETVRSEIDSSADTEISIFIKNFGSHINKMCGSSKAIDLESIWCELNATNMDKLSAIYELLRRVRAWEEQALF